jgi:hypothetical protein
MGIQLKVPPSLREIPPSDSIWIHEGSNFRVIVDFSPSSPQTLSQMPNYSPVRQNINGLAAVLCSYD